MLQDRTETNPGGARRKYTLEELEVEGFAASDESDHNKQHSLSSEEEELVDLNSLIEGAVDDDEEEGEEAKEGYHTALEEQSVKSGQVRIYFLLKILYFFLSRRNTTSSKECVSILYRSLKLFLQVKLLTTSSICICY